MSTAPIETRCEDDDGQTRTIRLDESAPESQCAVAMWNTTLPCPPGFEDLVLAATSSPTEEGLWLQENIQRTKVAYPFMAVILSFAPDGARSRWKIIGRATATETVNAVVASHVTNLADMGILVQGPVAFRPVDGSHLVAELCEAMVNISGHTNRPPQHTLH